MKKTTNYTDESIELMGNRFKLLGEPTRIKILLQLADGEKCVKDLVEELGYGQANTSKHLSLLANNGLVSRRKDGLHVYYSLSDNAILNTFQSAHKSIVNGLIEFQKSLG